jgi:hypothetical protein
MDMEHIKLYNLYLSAESNISVKICIYGENLQYSINLLLYLIVAHKTVLLTE